MSKNKIKVSDTSKRVALILKELLKSPLDYNKMLKIIREENKKPVYTKEVLSKYLNTLRALGLVIKRIDGQYTLLNFFIQITLTDAEAEAFNILETSVLKYGTNSDIHIFLEIKKRILKYLDVNSQSKINSYTEQCLDTLLGTKVKQFGQICDEEQVVKVKYKSIVYTVEPRQILFIDNKIYFECYDLKTYSINKFPVEKVTIVEQQPVKNKNLMYKNNVVFEVYGKLIDNYKLKDGERILIQDNEKKVIKTENEDYELLAKRLIRYKNNCKVLKPEAFRKYFNNFTNKILALYDEETSLKT